MTAVWRHRNKLVLLAILAGGGYVGIRFIRKKLQDLQDRELTVQLRSTRFNEHFNGNCQTALSAVKDLLPSLQEALQKELDAEAITEQLRLKPPNKHDLWNRLKIISFTRLVGGAYAYALLAVFMKVQLSILGGTVFKCLNEGSSISTDIQKKYLSTVQHLLKEGLHSLIVAVQLAAEMVLEQYSLKQKLTCEGVLQLVQDIKHQTSLPTPSHNGYTALSHRRRQHFLLQYVLPKETLLHQPAEVGGASDEQFLVLGTRDLLESAEMTEVLESCVNQMFLHTTAHVRESYTDACQQQQGDSSGLALARVIPLVCDTSLFLFTHSASHPASIQNLLSLKDLRTLSKNIYEAFGNTDNKQI